MAKLPITPSKALTPILKYGYNILDDLGFFSRAEKVIDLLPPKAQVGKGSDIITKIEELGGKQVKDELLFTGLKDEFIEAPRVTSQELKDYLNQNKTMIQEKVRSSRKAQEQKDKIEQEGDGIDDFLQDQIYYGRPDDRLGYNQGVPDWVTIEGFDVGGGDVSFTEGLTQINAMPLNLLKDTTRLLFSTRNNNLNLDVRGSPVVEEGEQNSFLQNFLTMAEQSKEPFVEIKKAGTDVTTIGNNDIGWLTYLQKRFPNVNDRGQNNVAVSNSLNEAQLQANRLLVDIEKPELKDKQYGEQDIDLKPKHEQYTVGGGDNYQEIILTAKEKQDKYINKLGEIPVSLIKGINESSAFRNLNTNPSFDAFKSRMANYEELAFDNNPNVQERKQASLNAIKKITGLSETDINNLVTARNIIPLDDSGNKYRLLIDLIKAKKGNFATKNLEITDSGEIFTVKPDYSVDVHFPEKNIVVYARTKDRINEDGGKTLATEELQSDLSQRGRPTNQGLAYGLRELKQITNRRTPIVHGDFMDAYNELDEISNIGDLRFNSLLLDNRQPDFDNTFKNVVGSPTFFDVTKQHQDKNFKKFTIPEIIDASQKKYKFHELKDTQVKNLTNLGFSKLDDASTIEQFYINKKAVLPSGERSVETLKKIQNQYENPNLLNNPNNTRVYDTFQQNKNKLYSNIEDFAPYHEFEKLGNIATGELSLRGNRLARKELVIDIGADGFMVNIDDQGIARLNDNFDSFTKIISPRHIIRNEFTPELIERYDAFAKEYVDNPLSGPYIANKLRASRKPDTGEYYLDENEPLTFEIYKNSPEFDNGANLNKFLENNNLPEKTINRLQSNIDVMNNYIKRYDGKRISISGKPFNYKDYLATVEESIKGLPFYQGGLKEFMKLKMKHEKALSKIDNILQKNSSNIIQHVPLKPVPYAKDPRYKRGEPEKFKFDFGNNTDEFAFEKLKNFEMANDNLKAFKKMTMSNSRKNIPSLPFIGDSKKFAEVGIKRLILKGIEEGYDSVSILPAHVHVERWQTPNLKQFYDVTIPSVVKDILKGTGQKAEIKKIFSDEIQLNKYNALKKLENVTDELINTKYNRKNNIANMSDVEMVEYLTKNVPSGKFPEGIDSVIDVINKSEFFINTPAERIVDIMNLYKQKYGEEITDGNLGAQLRILRLAHKNGVKNVDELFDGTAIKAPDRGAELDPETIMYNDLIKNLYVGSAYSGTGAYLPSITIKLTPELKEYAQSGISLYTSLPVAVGTGAVTAQQILGTEEDIVEEEDDIL